MKGGVHMLESFTTAFTFVWSEFGNAVDFISARPVLLVMPAIGVAGAVLGLGKRLFRVGGRRR